MTEAVITQTLAKDWITVLLKRSTKIWRIRRNELERIYDDFGDVELLAKSYIEPDCQPINPAEHDEDEPIPTHALRVPIRDWINEFLGKRSLRRDGRNILFVLSDAGMGKSSLLMMLKLTHLLSFWPSGLDFRLYRLGCGMRDQLKKLSGNRTVLLLDALDEDPRARGRIERRVTELLHSTKRFRNVIITCRTQFFPKRHESLREGRGKVEVAGFVCNLLFLSPFSNRQVERYLEKKYPNRWLARFRKWLADEDNQQLVRARQLVIPMQSLRMRPMLLSYIEDLLEAGITNWSEYPVYRTLVESWLLREQRKRAGGPRKEELWEACQLVALHFYLSGERIFPSSELVRLLSDRPVELETFDVGGRSLLNSTSNGDYRFSHFSIQEFLVAYSIVSDSRILPAEALRPTDQILDFIFSWILEAPKDRAGWKEWSRLDLDGLDLDGFQRELWARLRAADLRGSDFRDANFRGANLHGANARSADFQKADLRDADFVEADLVDTDFRNANLVGANLRGTKLRGSGFQNADLRDADLLGADLRSADLRCVNLQGANLRDARLWGANLQGAQLQQADLQGASLERASLADANLTDADLSGAGLVGAILQKAVLQGARLVQARLGESNFQGANLRDADFTGATIADADLRDVNLSGADLSGASLGGANLVGANLKGATFKNTNLIGAIGDLDLADDDLRT